MSAETLRNAVVSKSWPAIRHHRHLRAGSRVPANRTINRSTTREGAPAHRRVAATEAPISELGNQRFMGK